MSGTFVDPSVEKRLGALIELSRRRGTATTTVHPTVTISREFGCEGLLIAEKTRALLQEKTGETWGLVDRGILDQVTSSRELSDELLTDLGEKSAVLDDVLSTLFSEWRSDKEHYKRLCNQMLPYAKQGNVVMVGVGAAILTQALPNCHKFRLIAPMEFKVKGVAARHQLTDSEAEKLIVKRQKQRNDFIKNLLNKDITDITLYDVIFNNATSTADQIAEMICYHTLTGKR